MAPRQRACTLEAAAAEDEAAGADADAHLPEGDLEDADADLPDGDLDVHHPLCHCVTMPGQPTDAHSCASEAARPQKEVGSGP